ncbi:MAG: DUF1559 domain-containing protein [Planctomycetaceae bacterium]
MSRLFRNPALWAGLGIVGVLLVLAVPAVRNARFAAARDATRADLRSIGLALHNYHDRYESFPPAFTLGPDGRRWHSWRALILPYLDEPELAAAYRLDEPWDGPNNSKLHTKAPAVFQSDVIDHGDSATNYFAIIGRRTAWPAHQALKADDFKDGVSNTILLVEDPKVGVVWSEPRDLPTGEFFKSFYGGTETYPGGGAGVLLADGTFRFLSRDIDRSVLAGLLTPQYHTETFQGDDWPEDLEDEIPNQKFSSPPNADDLTQTDIFPSSAVPLEPTRNQLWCAAFQISWDMMNEQLGGPAELSPSAPVVDLLNRHPFDVSALSPESFSATATGVSTSETTALLEELRQKFQTSSHLPSR